jgi:hypothetical protein
MGHFPFIYAKLCSTSSAQISRDVETFQLVYFAKWLCLQLNFEFRVCAPYYTGTAVYCNLIVVALDSCKVWTVPHPSGAGALLYSELGFLHLCL